MLVLKWIRSRGWSNWNCCCQLSQFNRCPWPKSCTCFGSKVVGQNKNFFHLKKMKANCCDDEKISLSEISFRAPKITFLIHTRPPFPLTQWKKNAARDRSKRLLYPPQCSGTYLFRSWWMGFPGHFNYINMPLYRPYAVSFKPLFGRCAH